MTYLIMYNTGMSTPSEDTITLSRASEKDCARIYALLEEAFDKSERRDYADFIRAAKYADYIMFDIMRADTVVGFIGAWTCDDILYIEHLATYAQYRNMGYGATALKLLQTDYPAIVLEIEPPETDLQKRRRGFYERLGFVMNDCEYLQPPFRADDAPFPLKLMSYPMALSDAQPVVREIYEKVYNTDFQTVIEKYKKSRKQ